MELSDLKLGDVVQVKIVPGSSWHGDELLLVNEGTATVIGLDYSAAGSSDVLLGWSPTDTPMHTHGVGYPKGKLYYYLPQVEDSEVWKHAMWACHSDIEKVIGTHQTTDQINQLTQVSVQTEQSAFDFDKYNGFT